MRLIIVLYPQTVPVYPGGTINPGNPNGCWDWWGFMDPLPQNRDYARKTGYQISAIKAMVDRLAEKFVSGGGTSDIFRIPQEFSAADNTSTSVALIWRPNGAATGFNIYRSPSSAGSYTKINNNPVSGSSFADRGLTPTTTYYYKIRAIDGSNQESAPTAAVYSHTAAQPPACDPYFSDNKIHVSLGRAFPIGTNTFAVGSLDLMGPFDSDHFSHLTKDTGPLPSYHVRYCP